MWSRRTYDALGRGALGRGGALGRRRYRTDVKRAEIARSAMFDSSGTVYDPYDPLVPSRTEGMGVVARCREGWRRWSGHVRTLFAAVAVAKKVNGFSAQKISKDLEDLYVSFVETYARGDAALLREITTPHLFAICRTKGAGGKRRKGRRRAADPATSLRIDAFHDNANLLQLRVLRSPVGQAKDVAFAQATVLFKPTISFPIDDERSGRRDVASPADRWRRAIDEDTQHVIFRNEATGETSRTEPNAYSAVRASIEPNDVGSIALRRSDEDAADANDRIAYDAEQVVVFELPFLATNPQWRVASF